MILRKKLHMQTMLTAQQHAQKVRDALAGASKALPVLLATVPSSDPKKKPYRIAMGANNAVWCNCKGFQNRSKCRHMDRFRSEVVVVEFK